MSSKKTGTIFVRDGKKANIRFEGFENIQKGDRIQLDKDEYLDASELFWEIVTTPKRNKDGILEVVANPLDQQKVLEEST